MPSFPNSTEYGYYFLTLPSSSRFVAEHSEGAILLGPTVQVQITR